MMNSITKWLALSSLLVGANAFYIPGVQPQEFKKGDKVEMKVNSMTSYHTQIPKDYYRLPFCQPAGGPTMASENLGEFLTGNKIQSSAYELNMQTEMYCKIVCQVQLNKVDAAKMRLHIKYGYHNNWIIDNLPSASVGISATTNEKQTHYAGGFPIGFLDSRDRDKKAYIFNHANIYLDYNEFEPGKYRIVSFAVEPMSIKHSFKASDLEEQATLTTCNSGQHMERFFIMQNQMVVGGETITYTYDVIWNRSDVEWASRWDVYLSENNLVPPEVHWYPITNALLFILFLSLMVTVVLVRHLRKDTEASMTIPLLVESRNTEPTGAEEETTDGMSGDVQQAYPMLLSVCAGNGFQLLLCSLMITILSALGILNPSHRGHLLQAFLLLYMIFGIINGYISSRMYKAFDGEQKNLCTLASAFGVSGATFLVFVLLNVMSIFYSSATAPLTVVIVLAVMCVISAAMVFAGAHFGYKQDTTKIPTISRVDTKGKRAIPLLNMSRSKIITFLIIGAVLVFSMMRSNEWMDYILGLCLIAVMILLSICATFRPLPRWVKVLSAGALPFVVIYVELFFVMTGIWMYQYYYVYEYTLMCNLAFIVVVAEVTVLLVYNELCLGTARVWWLSFLAGASIGLYAFIYSAFWFGNLEPADMIITYATYFGYMSIFCLAIALVAGSISLLAALFFVRTIIGAQTE